MQVIAGGTLLAALALPGVTVALVMLAVVGLGYGWIAGRLFVP